MPRAPSCPTPLASGSTCDSCRHCRCRINQRNYRLRKKSGSLPNVPRGRPIKVRAADAQLLTLSSATRSHTRSR